VAAATVGSVAARLRWSAVITAPCGAFHSWLSAFTTALARPSHCPRPGRAAVKSVQPVALSAVERTNVNAPSTPQRRRPQPRDTMCMYCRTSAGADINAPRPPSSCSARTTRVSCGRSSFLYVYNALVAHCIDIRLHVPRAAPVQLAPAPVPAAPSATRTPTSAVNAPCSRIAMRPYGITLSTAANSGVRIYNCARRGRRRRLGVFMIISQGRAGVKHRTGCKRAVRSV
jgi:hypothetical protein